MIKAQYPTVSVIIPNYNHEYYLKKRIESVLNQTYQDFEVIILDDSSSDNSRNIIEEYRSHPKISQILYNNQNSGSPFKQWIKGISLASGAFIWIAESDDTASSSFLDTLLSYAENNDCDLIYCRSSLIDNYGNENGLDYWPDELDSNRWKQNFTNDGKEEVVKYMLYRNTIVNASSVIFRKELFPMNSISILQTYKYFGDWLIWCLMGLKAKIGYVAEPLNQFRRHPDSVINKVESIKKKRNLFYEAMKIIRTIENEAGLKSNRKIYVQNYDWLVNGYLANMNKYNFWKRCFLSPPLSGALKEYYYQNYRITLQKKINQFFK